jgi:hypothetical protein
VAHRHDPSPYGRRRGLLFLLALVIVLSGIVVLAVALYAQVTSPKAASDLESVSRPNPLGEEVAWRTHLDICLRHATECRPG